MPLDPNIPLQVQGPKFESPLSMFANILQVRNAQQQFQENQIKLQQQVQAERDNQALRLALQSRATPTGVDSDAVIGDLMSGGFGTIAIKYADSVYEQRKKLADGMKVQGEVLTNNLTLSSQILQGVTDDASFQRAKSVIGQLMGPEAAGQLGQAYDPKIVKEAVAWGRTAADHTTAQNKALEFAYKAMDMAQTAMRDERAYQEALPKIEEQWRLSLGTAAQAFSSQEDVEKLRGFMQQFGPVAKSVAQQYLPEGTQFSPDLVKRLSSLAITPADKATLQDAATGRSIQQQNLDLERQKFSFARDQALKKGASDDDYAPFALMVAKQPDLVSSLSPTERAKVLKYIASNQSGEFQSAKDQTSISMIDEALQTIQTLKTGKGMRGAIGAPSLSEPGSFGRLIPGMGGSLPGSNPAGYEEDLKKLKSQLTLPRMDYLRGMGHASDADVRMLTESASSLGSRLGEAKFVSELEKQEQRLTALKEKVLARSGATATPNGTINVPPDVMQEFQNRGFLPGSKLRDTRTGTVWVVGADKKIKPE